MTKKLAFTICCLVVFKIGYTQRTDFWGVNFYKADSIAEVYADRSLKDTKKLAEDLTKNLPTEVEKFRAIFRWITDNIHYDYDLYVEAQIKEKKLRRRPKELQAWKRKFSNKVDRRLVNKKSTICAGYASLLEKMSNHIGISCTTITGYTRTGLDQIRRGSINHAWNAVKLGMNWYLCDATWASSKLNDYNNTFIRRFDKNYFLTDPSLFIANHYPADTTWMLLQKKPTLNEFFFAPMKFEGFIANKVNTYYPSKGILKVKNKECVSFEFTCNASEEEQKTTPYLWIEKLKDDIEIKRPMAKDSDGNYSTEHTFEDRGNYTAHVVIGGKIAMTYKVYAK
jgi:transglutaminase/protease-like cytokinesis protein 3